MSERDTGACFERKSYYFNNQLSKDEEGKFKSVLVKSKKAADDIKQVAVKKIPRQQPITTNASGKTPLPESCVQTPNAAIKRSEKDYHTVLKR